MCSPSERAFETAICQSLVTSGGYHTVKVGNAADRHAGDLEDAVVKTIAGFANSFYGGTLLVGVTDAGGIYGLRTTVASFSKRGERGDRDLWGQHLKNLLDRVDKSAAALVDWEFFTIDSKDISRVSIDPSDHPVFEMKSDQESRSSGGAPR